MMDSTPGERLRRRRREMGISAAELGRRAAVSVGRNKPISASAVRNQENGTNGIPISIAHGYAAVLKVDPLWILFGSHADSPSEHDRAAYAADKQRDLDEHGPLEVSDLRIETYGVISAAWLPQMVKADHDTEMDDDLLVFIPGWSTSGAPLLAYEVADRTLEPVYQRGTWLVVVSEEDAYVQDGNHVVACRFARDGSDIEQAVRQVRVTKDGIDLVGIGAQPVATVPLVRGGEAVSRIWIEELVVASHYVLKEGRGPPLLGIPRIASAAPKRAAGSQRKLVEQTRATRVSSATADADDDESDR